MTVMEESTSGWIHVKILMRSCFCRGQPAGICRWIYRLGLDRWANFISRLNGSKALTPIDLQYKY